MTGSIYAFALQIDSKSWVKTGKISSLESDKMLSIFFCQIIMGSPLNSIVPEGLSMICMQALIPICTWRPFSLCCQA